MQERYYQKEIETMPVEEIKKLQSEKLVKQVKHVYENVPYYRDLMDQKGVTPADIHGIEDLHKLPFLTKADLRDAYPYGLLAKPLSECVRIQSTSGTTGKRVVAFYTQHDVDLWEDCCARAITAVGGTNEDVCQVLRLRTVHRRPRTQRRLAQGGLSDAAHVLRLYRETDPVHDGSQGHHSLLHPLLRRLHR